MTIISATEFNPSKDVCYKAPWTNTKGMKSVGINSSLGSQLQLRVPMMLTWGVNENEHEVGKKKYDLSLQFPRQGEETPQSKQFLTAMTAFEDQLIDDAVRHSSEWWNQKNISRELAADRFNRMLYRPKDKISGEPIPGKSPSFRVKLDCWDGEFECEIYDNSSDPDRQPLYPSDNVEVTPMSLIPKMANIACLIKCGGIYFSNGKFGVTWRLVQAIVKPRVTSQVVKGKCQISLSESELSQLAADSSDDDEKTLVDDDGFEATPPVAAAPVVAAPVAATEAKPKPKARRKVVRRAKAP
jgi:hypothetical protein